MFIATINTPGYLPTDDDPPIFDTAREAWEHLAFEREMHLFDAGEGGYDAAHAEMVRRAVGTFHPLGPVYGPTPGYEGDHDLGLVYSVTEAEV